MPIRLASLKSGLAAGALCAFASVANAQTLLPELLVISPSLVPIEASKTGSSVTVMTGEEARSSGFTQLADVMRTFPGIAVNQSGARGSLTQFRVRGTEANQLLVMIDGVPANSVSDGEYNFADIPLDDIERIELLRGPQSGLYGANAHSGVLTIETKSGRGLAKPEFTAKLEGGTQKSAEGSATFRGALGPFYGSTTATYATTNGFNIARDGNETDGAKRASVTSKAGVDLTPYFNVEGFIRHLYRNAETDPQDPFFLNNGLVVDAPGYNTKTEETLARVQGTLKLFDDRWIQSAKWTGSRTGVTGIENFAQTSASLGTAQTLTYKSSVVLDSNLAGGEKHTITGLVENCREYFNFDSIFLFGPDLDAAHNGHTRTTNSVGGEYVLDLLRTGTTISIAQRQDFNEHRLRPDLAPAGDRDPRRDGQHRRRDGGRGVAARDQRRGGRRVVADVGAAGVLRRAGDRAVDPAAGAVRTERSPGPMSEPRRAPGSPRRRSRWGPRGLTVGVVAVIAAIFVAFPLVITDPTTTSIAVFTLVFMVATSAWNIFSGYSGYLALGHAVFFGSGGYAVALAARDWHVKGGWDVFALLPFGGLVAGLIAVPVGLVALRTRRHTFVVVTIAIFFIFQLAAFNLSFTGGTSGILLPLAALLGRQLQPALLLRGAGDPGPDGRDLVGGAPVTVRPAAAGDPRRRGPGARARRQDRRVKLTAFVLSAVPVGMVGGLYFYFLGQIFPQFAFDPLFDLSIALMAFLGGIGTLVGPLLGALVLESLQQYLTQTVSSSATYLIVYGVLFLVVILLLPRGVVPG